VQENIEAALSAGAGTGPTVVLGSFYLVGEALKILTGRGGL
jgi:folylpolyglutamate synthase/dihydropteroate synthase